MTLKVIAQDFIRPDAIDTVSPLYRELLEKKRQEPACIAYDLFIDQKDPGHFIFIEKWPDRAALDQHCQNEHFKRLVPQIDAHQRQAGSYILMDEVRVCRGEVPEAPMAFPANMLDRFLMNEAGDDIAIAAADLYLCA